MQEILEQYQFHDPNQIRMTKGANPFIDDAVFKWMTVARNKGIAITEEMLKVKALEFKKEFIEMIDDNEKLENFEASSGWIKNFKKRFNIKTKHLYGESRPIDEGKLTIARKALKEEHRCFYLMMFLMQMNQGYSSE